MHKLVIYCDRLTVIIALMILLANKITVIIINILICQCCAVIIINIVRGYLVIAVIGGTENRPLSLLI